MTIEERVERLERQNTTLACANRRLWLWMLGLAIAAGLGVLVGTRSQDPQEMTLRKLVIVDEEGRERIVLGGKDDRNAASIQLSDKDGNERIMAVTRPDGVAMVSHSDKNGEIRIRAKTRPDGLASVTHRDKDGKLRIFAGTLPNGSSSTVGYDK